MYCNTFLTRLVWQQSTSNQQTSTVRPSSSGKPLQPGCPTPTQYSWRWRNNESDLKRPLRDASPFVFLCCIFNEHRPTTCTHSRTIFNGNALIDVLKPIEWRSMDGRNRSLTLESWNGFLESRVGRWPNWTAFPPETRRVRDRYWVFYGSFGGRSF